MLPCVIDLERHGEVYRVRMESGENRFTPESLEAWSVALDEVETAEGSRALVTVGSDRFYSNGLDLEHMTSVGPEAASTYLQDVLALLARVLVFPAITVAAINGHAFGAGALLALAHDFRVMRTGRGFFCMPEADMHVPLHPGMTAILRARLPRQTAHEVIATARRWPAEEALAHGIVEEVAPEAEVLPRALARAEELAGKAHPSLRALKQELYAPVLESLSSQLDLAKF
jgi:enoyl-CoA hydratase/carnithine racemase